MAGFLRHRFGRLIFGGAYTWRGLFSEFYGISFLAQVSVNLVFQVQLNPLSCQDISCVFPNIAL